jgi:predicted RNA-binding Zn ribbon-like protein
VSLSQSLAFAITTSTAHDNDPSSTASMPSDQLEFVRACASKTCEWLFLDESKNHRRRWCDITKCGNRAKVKRFYTRQKKLR